jgi:hypothetical protein
VNARRRRFDLGFVGHVGRDRQGFAPQLLHVVARAVESVEATCEQGHAPAMAGELPGDRPADARRRTCHDHRTPHGWRVVAQGSRRQADAGRNWPIRVGMAVHDGDLKGPGFDPVRHAFACSMSDNMPCGSV